MVDIEPFIAGGAFAPEETQAMSKAFDAVCEALRVTNGARSVREAIAMKIIARARNGEHDPERLREAVLKEIGLGDGQAGARTQNRRGAEITLSSRP
jgi:hypothetical protein